MHISYGGSNFCEPAQGYGITREVFVFPRIKTHGGDEFDESEAAGCEVEGMVEPGEVRGAESSDVGGIKW